MSAHKDSLRAQHPGLTPPGQGGRHRRGTLIKRSLSIAAGVHWKRNLVLHGDVTCRVTGTARQLQVTLEASGRHNGRDRVLNYTPEQIEDLFYEVIHATALIRFSFPDLTVLRLSSLDTETLREFAAAHLTPSNESTQLRPPQSFEV